MQSDRAQEIVRAEVLSGTLLGRVQAQVSQADRLLADVEEVLTRAKAEGDARTVLASVKTAALALNEARNGAELVGRLAGELRGDGVQVNVVEAPEWKVLRDVILGALAPHPAALVAVTQALREYRTGGPALPRGEGRPALPAGVSNG